MVLWQSLKSDTQQHSPGSQRKYKNNSQFLNGHFVCRSFLRKRSQEWHESLIRNRATISSVDARVVHAIRFLLPFKSQKIAESTLGGSKEINWVASWVHQVEGAETRPSLLYASIKGSIIFCNYTVSQRGVSWLAKKPNCSTDLAKLFAWTALRNAKILNWTGSFFVQVRLRQ